MGLPPNPWPRLSPPSSLPTPAQASWGFLCLRSEPATGWLGAGAHVTHQPADGRTDGWLVGWTGGFSRCVTDGHSPEAGRQARLTAGTHQPPSVGPAVSQSPGHPAWVLGATGAESSVVREMLWGLSCDAGQSGALASGGPRAGTGNAGRPVGADGDAAGLNPGPRQGPRGEPSLPGV